MCSVLVQVGISRTAKPLLLEVQYFLILDYLVGTCTVVLLRALDRLKTGKNSFLPLGVPYVVQCGIFVQISIQR